MIIKRLIFGFGLGVLFFLLPAAEGQKKIEMSQSAGKVKAKYVVAPNGLDQNPGTEEKPFATIQKAANMAKAGDVVLVKAGVYCERVEFPNSGEPGKPITFLGERGTDGKWLTAADPGVSVTGWEPALEIGPGVYKTDRIPSNPRCITLNGKHLARISDWMMSKDRNKLLPFEKLKKVPNAMSRQTDPGIFGFNLLRLPADAITDASYVGELPYWDGIEALYGYFEGMTYIRFRNGDDPGNMALKASTGNETFLIKDQSHIILKNFYIGGSWHSVIIKGKKATGNIIEGNYITHGRTRVLIEDEAAGNIIENNIMTLNYYGYDNPGAWGMRTTSLAKTRCHIYQEFKHTVGPNGSDDHGVEVRRAGAGNIVRDNRIKGGLIGVHVRTTPRLQVSRNIISNMSSIGICTSRGTNEAIFNNNLVYDCNINLRIHHFNELDSNLKRKEYYYRNIFYFPEKTSGCNLFVHLIPANSPNQIKNLDDEPEIFFYHNTLVGGVGLQQATEMKKTVLLNNIFSYSPEFVITRYKKRRGQPELFEVMDHNLMVAPEGFPDREYPKWLGKNNIYVTAPLKWEADRFFEISGNSIYREKGIDLSKKFIFNGKEYEPFPGMEPGYFKGEKPDIGALQYGEKAGSWFTRELRESNSLP